MRFLLDTHVLLHWFIRPGRLSREQARVLNRCDADNEPVAICASTLLEIAVLSSDHRLHFDPGVTRFLRSVEGNDRIVVLPLDFDVAIEAGHLAVLRDPVDRAIVATARVHGLTLLTSDQRIAESRLTPLI